MKKDTSKARKLEQAAHVREQFHKGRCDVVDRQLFSRCWDVSFTRIFNCFKNPECDRQIGDRRLANQTERRLSGPSRQMPVGFMMTGIHVPLGRVVRGSITDRKDFYHQARATVERAATNVLPFQYERECFAAGFQGASECD